MNNKQQIVKLPNIKSDIKTETKINSSTEFVLYFDGCSKGNPGHAGIGAVIYKNGVEQWASCKYIGNDRTNNEAEYSALILGLQAAIDQDIKTLSVCGDSLLVINQVNKIYNVKNSNLFKLYEIVNNLKQKFTYIDFNHVYRKDNKRADQLSNLALDFMDDSETQSIMVDDIIVDTNDWDEELVIEKMVLEYKKSK